MVTAIVMVQWFATVCVVLGNFTVAISVWHYPMRPIPLYSLSILTCGSMLWCAFAALLPNFLLLASSLTNLTIYAMTLAYRIRVTFRSSADQKVEGRNEQMIIEGELNAFKMVPESSSESSLPSLPPLSPKSQKGGI